MNELLMSIKRAIRPLIPDSVMARYRVRQHSRAMRTNVDLFVPNGREARRWMRLTPDTYRVVTGTPRRVQEMGLVELGENDDALTDLIGFEGIEVAVSGETLPPTMQRHRVSEPAVVPRSIVAVAEAMDEIGGIADNSVDLVRTYQRLSDAGRHVGLVPTVVERLPDLAHTSLDGPSAVVFAAVPLHDIGGGSRAAQLTFELLRTGFHVTYVSMYPSAEGVDLGLRYIHPVLEQYRIEALPLSGLLERARPGMVILEAPAEPFVAPASALKDRGWSIVYDIIDDWTDPSLGGDWYKPGIEQAIIDLADGVVASAPDLVRHGKRLGAETVLVPNAVNTELFGPVAADVPGDLPPGRLIGYHGSLYGEWFDWDALAAVADAYPSDSVVIIGDDRYQRSMPSNVAFLGLKPHADLPAYVQRFAVGLVPFELTEVTHAVSPLKVYEYLASGVAVAAPPLRALHGLEGVYTDEDLVKAVALAMDAPDPDREAALSRHSWRNRLERLFGAIDADMPSRSGAVVKTVRRTPAHYDRRDRWIRVG